MTAGVRDVGRDHPTAFPTATPTQFRAAFGAACERQLTRVIDTSFAFDFDALLADLL